VLTLEIDDSGMSDDVIYCTLIALRNETLRIDVAMRVEDLLAYCFYERWKRDKNKSN
jgi:hypothetical protein